MRKKIFIVLIIVLQYHLGIAQTFLNKVFNFASPDTILACDFLGNIPDSNYFICSGNSEDFSSTEIAFLGAVDYKGKMLWKKYLTCAGTYSILQGTQPIIEIPGKHYVVSGSEIDVTTRKDTVWMYHPFLYFFKANGDSIRFYKDTNRYVSKITSAITLTTRGHLIVTGTFYPNHIAYIPKEKAYYNDSTRLYIDMYDTLGNIKWQKKYFYGGKDVWIPLKAVPSKDGGAIITGTGHINGVGDKYHFVLKVDSTGNILWIKNYLPNKYFTRNSIDITPANGGGYFFSTVMNNEPNTGYAPHEYPLFGKINERGDLIWSKSIVDTAFTINGNLRNLAVYTPYSIKQDRYNNLLLLGTTLDTGQRVCLMILDSVGNRKYYREYTYPSNATFYNDNYLYTLNIMPDNKLLMTGLQEGGTNLLWKDTVGDVCWVVMTDSLGCLKPGCVTEDSSWIHSPVVDLTQNQILTVYPNPARDKLTIIIENFRGDYNNSSLQIMNMLGACVFSSSLPIGKQQINISQLPPGIYALSITNGASSSTQKLIIQR